MIDRNPWDHTYGRKSSWQKKAVMAENKTKQKNQKLCTDSQADTLKSCINGKLEILVYGLP